MSSIVEKFIADEGVVESFSGTGQLALELLASNPLVGFCLAHNRIFHKPASLQPLIAARSQLQKPQREILSWLGFKPATEAVAKVGRKCVPESLTLERALQLRRILVDDETRGLLAHLHRINAGVIELVASRQLSSAITPQLLNAVASNDDEVTNADTAMLLRDILRMRSMVRYKKDPLRPFHSKHRIVKEHDRLSTELYERGMSSQTRLIFPHHPIGGWQRPGEQITPIHSSDALLALGREQHNCVASYQDAILGGKIYIYRVEVQGEVCTLSIVDKGNKTYEIGELKAAYNAQPSELTQFVVRRWLSSGERFGQFNFGVAQRSIATNRWLPSAPLSGGNSNAVEIKPLRNRKMLMTMLENSTAVEYYCDRARRNHEFYYQAVTPQAVHLVVTQRIRGSYRLKEVRRVGGGSVSGDLLVAVSDWLGRTQGRYR